MERKEKDVYYVAREDNWFEEYVKNMVKDVKWTREKSVESALKFNTKRDWSSSDKYVYSSVRIYSWLTEYTAHMKCLRKPNEYWTIETCSESAKNYASSKVWAKCEKSAYDTAQRNGWLSECNSPIKGNILIKTVEISRRILLKATTRKIRSHLPSIIQIKTPVLSL